MTFEELKAAGFVEHHKCGGCGSPVGYQVHSRYAVAIFISACDCGTAAIPKDERQDYGRPLTHDEMADIPTPVTQG